MNDYQEKMKLKYQSVNNLWKDVKVPYITRVEAGKAKNLLIKKLKGFVFGESRNRLPKPFETFLRKSF